MTPSVSPRLVRTWLPVSLRRLGTADLPALAGGVSAVIGVLVLLGWTFHATLLTTMVPRDVAVVPNTALALALIGVAMLLFSAGAVGGRQRIGVGFAPDVSFAPHRGKVVVGNSVVSVAVANTGNERLKPNVSFVLLDAAGVQVSTASLQMDTFYAHTDTFVEVPLAALLQAGRYTIQLVLDDAAAGARASDDAIPLVIDAQAVGPAAESTASSGLTGVSQAGAGAQGAAGGGPQQVLPILVAGLAAGLGIALLFGLVVLVIRRRRQRI